MYSGRSVVLHIVLYHIHTHSKILTSFLSSLSLIVRPHSLVELLLMVIVRLLYWFYHPY